MSSSPLTDERRQTVLTPEPSSLAPNRAYIERVVPLLVFVISLLYLFLFRRYSAMDPDEGIVLQGAGRILRGEIPYRDFFTFYTPGSFYLLAGICRVFGDSFIVARTSIAIIGAGFSVVTYLLARRVCSRQMALLAAGLTMITGAAYRFLVLHNWYATFFACLSLYAAVRLLESHKITWAFATGSFVALTTLIEQSKGAGLCIGLLIGYVVLRPCGRIQAHRITAVGLGFVWPWMILLLYFGSRGALGAMLQDWLWPLQHYTQSNHVFYGYQNWSEDARSTIFYTGSAWSRVVKLIAVSPGFVIPLLPLVALSWLPLEMIWLNKKKSQTSTTEFYVLVSSALSGLLLSVLTVRADITHFIYLAPLWNVVLAWILGAREVRSSVLLTVRPYLIAYICIAFGLMGLALLLNVNNGKYRIETRRGVVMTNLQDTVVQYVQAHVAPGDNLLVYPYLPLYNYLTETVGPGRLDFFQSGMNTPEQARGIIASLRSSKGQALLFEPGFGEKFTSTWPNTPLTAIVDDPVADFIVRNYRVCVPLMGTSGSLFQFMVRKADPCPMRQLGSGRYQD
jgi:4-amino-4-deoxy-L-arabinose transferase-like glycosyltransferase